MRIAMSLLQTFVEKEMKKKKKKKATKKKKR